MLVHVRAVGRMDGRSEGRALVDDYASRFARAGRPVGLSFRETEVDPRRARGPAAEGEALAEGLAPGGVLVALDERGHTLSSPDFAARLSAWADRAVPEARLAIGGADGLAPEVRARADLVLSFGPMVWPHMLARVMLAEQLYRAATILAGTPYHRA